MVRVVLHTIFGLGLAGLRWLGNQSSLGLVFSNKHSPCNKANGKDISQIVVLRKITVVTKQLFKDTFGWGFLLWLIGYGLGIMLFVVVSASLIGWIIMPIGTAITLWVLFKIIKAEPFQCYILIAIVWVSIAVTFDYFFLVKAFKPEDGYYKASVYIYYALTFLLPLVAGWRKKAIHK